MSYENSIAYNSIASATIEQAKRAKPYYETAIEYWKQKGDVEQIKFFTDGLCFVNKRINENSLFKN